MMPTIRLTSRLTLFILFLVLTAAIAVGVRIVEKVSGNAVNRTPWARFCFGGAARCLGFRVRHRGRVANGPVLFVSNHISWSDIPILGGTAPLRFLSKAEVARWPIIGWLAVQAGTLFIQRGGGRTNQSRTEISSALEAGQSVLVFPEGTTTIGITVLPFHGRLLNAAIDANVPIQPISIGYRRHNRPDHLAPFIGDDEFQPHLLRILKQPAVDVTVVFHEPVLASAEGPITDLADSLHKIVAAGLADIHRGGSDASSSSLASLT